MSELPKKASSMVPMGTMVVNVVLMVGRVVVNIRIIYR